MSSNHEDIIIGLNELILSDKMGGREVEILKKARKVVTEFSKINSGLMDRLKAAEDKIDSIKSDKQREIDSGVKKNQVGKTLLGKVRGGRRMCINCENLDMFPVETRNVLHKIGICSVYGFEVSDSISYCKSSGEKD